MKHIHSYYSPNNLYNNIIEGLSNLGKDISKITLDDLHPVDEFHIRGDTATKDLSDEYIDAAERLTQLLNMQDRVKFRAASALDLPFDDNTFDGAWSIQMNMNVEDKIGWLKEMYRVLKPGARAVLYEVCGSKNSPLYFPVPWAQDSSMNFLISPDSYRDIMTSVGFKIEVWNDKTDLAQKAFARMKEPKADSTLPEVGLHMLIGNDFKTKSYNMRRNLDDERIRLIETLVIK